MIQQNLGFLFSLGNNGADFEIIVNGGHSIEINSMGKQNIRTQVYSLCYLFLDLRESVFRVSIYLMVEQTDSVCMCVCVFLCFMLFIL